MMRLRTQQIVELQLVDAESNCHEKFPPQRGNIKYHVIIIGRSVMNAMHKRGDIRKDTVIIAYAKCMNEKLFLMYG